MYGARRAHFCTGRCARWWARWSKRGLARSAPLVLAMRSPLPIVRAAARSRRRTGSFSCGWITKFAEWLWLFPLKEAVMRAVLSVVSALGLLAAAGAGLAQPIDRDVRQDIHDKFEVAAVPQHRVEPQISCQENSVGVKPPECT